MRKQVQREMVVRLHKLQGQILGIERMLESGRSCNDVLVQISSSRAALDRLANLMIAEHLETCLGKGMDETCVPDLTQDERVREVRKTLDRFLTSVETN